VGTDNLQIVRRIFADYSGPNPEAALAAFDPEVEWVNPPNSPTPVLHGHAGVLENMTDWARAWKSFRMEPHEWYVADDKVLVRVTMFAIGRETGVPIEVDQFQIWTLRDGKVTRMQMFFDRAPAFEAAGLSEETARPVAG
jgi:ketosteroid isomerase-like protein